MAADDGIVAEHFVFDYRFARAHGVEEVGLVVDYTAIAGGKAYFSLLFIYRRGEAARWVWMLRVPLLQIFIAQNASANPSPNSPRAVGAYPVELKGHVLHLE